jgi:hypothetical protein
MTTDEAKKLKQDIQDSLDSLTELLKKAKERNISLSITIYDSKRDSSHYLNGSGVGKMEISQFTMEI